MPLNLTTLAGKLVKVDVPFMGQSCKVSFDPMVLTQENVAVATASGDDAFVEFFCRLVKTWDVQKGQKKVPLTPAGVNGVPMLLLRAIYGEILSMGDGEMDEGKASSAT